MKMTIVIAIMGQLYDSKPFWTALIGNTNLQQYQTDLMIIDNAPDCGDNQQQFFERFVFPQWTKGQVTYYPQADNLGVVKSMQFAYENTDSDILAFIHNDLVIADDDWNVLVFDWFINQPETGLLGFFGAEGVHPSSGRFNVWNNMLEAEIHGNRFDAGSKEVAVLDGLCMIANRKMLDAKGGIDLTYDVHHFYDLDLSLESLERGYRNYILPIYCHHVSGVTACRPLFQDWAKEYTGQETGEQYLYQKNLKRFQEKWSHRLPYHISMGELK